MNITHEAIRLADALDDRVAEAAIYAIREAHAQGLANPGIDLIRCAAVKHRARLSAVASTLGHLRCAHCGGWIQAWCEPDEDDVTGCPHLGEADTAAIYHGLTIYMASGGKLLCAHTLPPAVARWMHENESTGAGGDHAPESCC